MRTGPAGGTTSLPPRARVAVAVGAAAGAASRASGRGRGTALPGRLALRLAPDLLTLLTDNRRVVLVSGTNGKTTTTRLTAAALRCQGPVVSNEDGANLRGGLVSTLLRARPAATAVLEVDERVLPAALAQTRPAAVVLLNLTRDQLDRNGEVARHVSGWTAGLRAAPGTTVVANADDPLVVAAVRGARPGGDGVVWVAAGQAWRHDVPLCPRCGSHWLAGAGPWRCAGCGSARPACDWAADGDAVRSPTGPPTAAGLALPGRVNVGNAALAAAAAAGQGVAVDAALAAMRSVTEIGGRYLQGVHDGHRLRLLLAKNPAGWAEVLDQLEPGSGPVVVTVNAEGADGLDTSWLWDVAFERLRGRRVAAAGERSADVSLRLQYADVEHVRCPDPLDAVAELAGDGGHGVGGPGRRTEVVANYTAFRRVRDRVLHEAAGTAA